MAIFNSIRMGSSGPSTYKINRSLRFNSADSAYLTRTPGSDGNLRVWTFSCWVKKGTLGTLQTFFSAGSVNPDTIIKFTPDDEFEISRYNSGEGGYVNQVTSKAKFRDPTAWYHLVGAVDTTESTASNRVKMYVNGEQITVFENDDYPALNFDYEINDASYAHYIGRHPGGQYYNGYIAEFHFIDGQRLTPSSFAETNADTGQWVPKEYTGSHGTNGFYLNFSDNSNTTSGTLGDDDSANSNDWTPHNLSVTAGIGNDSFIDTPTNNFAVLNQLDPDKGDISNGNLDYNTGTAEDCKSTFGFASGKWYAEFTCNGVGKGSWIGIVNDPNQRVDSTDSNTVFVVSSTDADYHPSSTAAVDTGGGWTTDDIIGIALDATNKTCDVYKNGSKIYGFTSFTVNGPYYFAFDRASSSGSSITHSINFGQRPFSHQVSTYNAVCSANLPTPTIKKGPSYFNTVTYTGDGQSNRQVTGVGFLPAFTWIKSREATEHHVVFDAERGVTKRLRVDTNDAEDTGAAHLTAFTSDGFTVGTHDNVNKSSDDYASWNWKGGTSGSGDTSGSGTAKTYTSDYNATAGFSVTKYTGNGTSGHTIPHSLGVAPDVIIVKRTNTAEDWVIYCGAIEGNAGFYLKFETGAGTNGAGAFNQTNPTSSVFTLGDNDVTNGDDDTYIAYAFSSVAGYSKFGKYTGNGADDGPYVDLGFRPAMIITKRLNDTSNWYTFDNKRETFNVRDYRMELQSNAVEYGPYDNRWDFLSNGIKLRSLNAGSNADDSSFLYMAWAALPGKYTNAG